MPMRPEHRSLLLAWISAILEHAKSLQQGEREGFVAQELRRLENDFAVVLLWEDGKIVLSLEA
jgi:hypothetical protein